MRARHVVTNFALTSMALILIGLFVISTTIALYAISRTRAKNEETMNDMWASKDW